MRKHFAEVLARESACLAGVTDGAKPAGWRHRVVEKVMTPCSPYPLALRQTGDVSEHACFLGRWRSHIADTLDRLLQSGDMAASCRPSTQPGRGDVDPEEIAVLILAALHGGTTLSQVA